MMFLTRNELLAQFTDPVFESYPVYSSLRTFSCLKGWDERSTIELAKLHLEIIDLDFFSIPKADNKSICIEELKFQQNCFRLWYQIDGTGILQNTTRGTFGTARPGLLGIIYRGERYTYLHQKGNFECFQLLFSLLPSNQAKCYWNSEKECGVDINYLNIVFKKGTGKNLCQYVTGVRLKHAKHLLETSNIPITSIADKIGYPNSNSFTRAFKRHVKKHRLTIETPSKS